MARVGIAYDGDYWYVLYSRTTGAPRMMVKDTTRYNSRDEAIEVIEKGGHSPESLIPFWEKGEIKPYSEDIPDIIKDEVLKEIFDDLKGRRENYEEEKRRDFLHAYLGQLTGFDIVFEIIAKYGIHTDKDNELKDAIHKEIAEGFEMISNKIEEFNVEEYRKLYER